MCAGWVNCHFSFSCTGDRVWTPEAAMVNCCFPCLCLTSYFLALTFLLILRLIVLSVFCCTLQQMVPTTGELCFLFFFLVAGFFAFACGSWLLFHFTQVMLFCNFVVVTIAYIIVVDGYSCNCVVFPRSSWWNFDYYIFRNVIWKVSALQKLQVLFLFFSDIINYIDINSTNTFLYTTKLICSN